jgi:hypothetical protein
MARPSPGTLCSSVGPWGPAYLVATSALGLTCCLPCPRRRIQRIHASSGTITFPCRLHTRSTSDARPEARRGAARVAGRGGAGVRAHPDTAPRPGRRRPARLVDPSTGFLKLALAQTKTLARELSRQAGCSSRWRTHCRHSGRIAAGECGLREMRQKAARAAAARESRKGVVLGPPEAPMPPAQRHLLTRWWHQGVRMADRTPEARRDVWSPVLLMLALCRCGQLARAL